MKEGWPAEPEQANRIRNRIRRFLFSDVKIMPPVNSVKIRKSLKTKEVA